MRVAFKKIYFLLLLIYIVGNVYSQSNVYSLKTVVIDAGHGGKDPGAVGKYAKEKDITLSIALKTGKYIQEKIPGVKVIYTRSTDEFIELHKRAEIANKNNADLFISIHVNASTNTAAYGTDSWIMGLHKSKANLEVAKLENKVIMVEDDYSTKYRGMSADSTEAIIIYTMMQSANLEHSASLGSMVQSQLRDKVGRKDRGVHSAPFMVLWKTSMPSILIETGFLSNLDEEQFLMTDNGQDLMASAIYRAFKEYKTSIETKSNIGITSNTANEQPNSTNIINNSQKNDEPILPKSEKQTVKTTQDSIKKTIQIQQTNTQVTTEKIVQPQQTDKQVTTEKVVQTQQTEKHFTQNQQTTPTETIIQNPPKNLDITYSIQIASSKNKIEANPHNFKGLEKIFIIQEDGWNKYYYGTTNTFKDITSIHKNIKTKYPESFIVARKNGSKLPVQEAKKITQ